MPLWTDAAERGGDGYTDLSPDTIALCRTLIAGDHKIVFECKGPIILVMAACTGEPETQVRRGP